jgi:hypothetical protein
VAIYDGQGNLLETTTTSKQVTRQVPSVPQESRKPPRTVSQDAQRYFTRLREKHQQMQRQQQQTPFTELLNQQVDQQSPQDRPSQEQPDA